MDRISVSTPHKRPFHKSKTQISFLTRPILFAYSTVGILDSNLINPAEQGPGHLTKCRKVPNQKTILPAVRKNGIGRTGLFIWFHFFKARFPAYGSA